MNFKYKKHLIVLFSLLLFYISICKNIVFAERHESSPMNESHVNNASISKIIKTNNWKNICKYWKNLNALESQNDHNANYKMMQSLEEGFNKIKKDFDTLKNTGLLNQNQVDYLISLIDERINYLRFSLYLVKCYEASEIGTKIANTRKDLEKRYDTLQNLFITNKINSETFKTTTKQLQQDLEFLDSNSEKQKVLKDQKLLDLIIYLNK
ncbi:MAG: hypothetical protein AB1782_18990 [Cyanobacteriota bacterium]